MRNILKNMAELTYAELTQGQESTRLPHTHKLTSLKKKQSFWSKKSRYQDPKCPVTQDACFHDLYKRLNNFCQYKV